ncbi:hypothetical protein SBFV3_gp02 [Sulfolobales Beppu filamentous virus 3]|uniref:Uncharacterized protein n=1 Tax=Sulfolobales Beppu filamentous virus 3 TaxID=2493124 RepID=A0A3Q8Q3U9_9VIRU|nr:hypothetical protein HOU83_gp02 [Sulfolobales Beppu filamentous virus 3]AZI75837.1 hypothetical protein SBFV3_gp02 [Sulfolobales Beppu filamentous virus 3]
MERELKNILDYLCNKVNKANGKCEYGDVNVYFKIPLNAVTLFYYAINTVKISINDDMITLEGFEVVGVTIDNDMLSITLLRG